MKAIDKIRLILGEEGFEKFKRNYYSDRCLEEPIKLDSLEEFCERGQKNTILGAFDWSRTPEGNYFWHNLADKIYLDWNTIEDTIIYPRVITKEEHDEIFKMFVLEFMGWKPCNEFTFNTWLNCTIVKTVYDALKCEE